MKRNIATFFGLGYIPFSASLSSLVALFVFVAMRLLSGQFPPANLLLFALIFLWSIYVLYRDRIFASRDPKEIVIDEFLGMYACLLIATPSMPVGFGLFFIFRLLDGFKPYPVTHLDRICKSWWGVVGDDIVLGAVIAIFWRLMLLLL